MRNVRGTFSGLTRAHRPPLIIRAADYDAGGGSVRIATCTGAADREMEIAARTLDRRYRAYYSQLSAAAVQVKGR